MKGTESGGLGRAAELPRAALLTLTEQPFSAAGVAACEGAWCLL